MRRRIMGLSSNSEWASLPVDILDSILDYLVPMRDYLGFSEVCGQWKYAVRQKLEDLRSNHRRHCRLHQQLPLLLLIPNLRGRNRDRFCLYDVVQGKIVWEFQLKRGNWRFEGSSHGWLILLHLRTHQVTLFNPVSGKFIHLPPIDKSIPDIEPYPKRCVLSINKDKFVLVMSSCARKRRVAFIKSGDEDWTYVKKLRYLEDIACIDRIFYLVDSRNAVFSCDVDVNNDGFELRWIPSPVDRSSLDRYFVESIVDRIARDQYLVESPEGDLLRVEKNKTGFLVYKFIWFSRNSRWEEVKNLGDVAIFLGQNNNSISVMASDFPGWQPNSIYYFSESKKIPSSSDNEVYVFSLNDRTFTLLCPNFPRPVLWISPNQV